ncbi:MAG: short-chain dehydrogenase [Rhodobacteraceae bacterium]|nr:MAG: short-chain dehydrogenase [Paracoccaceae bacterium]|tara:strand:+ start:1452 stop:2183 length:732 start_codon:yes stop_codon:yes gene_type:complete
MKIAGKKVLLTGANGGIGQAILRRLHGEGALIAATDLNVDYLDAKVRFNGNLLDKNFCDELPKRVYEALGGLDILINNAGVIRRGKITESSDEDLEVSMKVNVEAPFRLCRASIPLLNQGGGGAIVNIASCWGIHPGPSHPIYVMTKAAIASLTQCLGRDHASENIRVNAVCPNEVNTPMIKSGFSIRGLDPNKGIEELNKTVPLGRIAEPEDIADVVAFLLSDAARYMCGSLVEVNGGKAVS